MPLIILSVGGLAAWGLYSLPEWAREIFLAFFGFLTVCAVLGFLYALIKRSFMDVFNKEARPEGAVQQQRGLEDQASNPQPVAPVTRPDPMTLRRQVEEISLIEDEFLR